MLTYEPFVSGYDMHLAWDDYKEDNDMELL